MLTRRIISPAFPIPGVKVCDECKRPKKIKRNHAGRSYCDACYQREFPHMPCAACGEDCRAKRGTVVPYCRRCEAERRLCKGCGRPVPRAGMYHEGEVVCPSCVPKYKPKEPCPACGEPSSRLSRVGAEGDAICDHCRNEQDHATCGTCGRYRKQAGEKAGKPICVECIDGTTHTCPDCQQDVPGGGSSRCRDCAARARGRARLEACCGTIGQPWVQDLFRSHCETDLLAAPRGDVVKRIDKATAFFSTMDTSMVSSHSVTPESLLEAYGPEGLRRASKAALFVTKALTITWPLGATDDFAERRRIEAMLDEIGGRPWGCDIAVYASDLQSQTRARPLRLHTVRMYLRAAITLMKHAQVDAVSDLEDENLRRFEARHRGHRASLSAFYAWARLTPPAGKGRHPIADEKASERALLSKSDVLMSALESSTSRAQAMALTAALISLLYGKPLRSVLNLRNCDVSRGRRTTMQLGGDEIHLDEKIAKALARWTQDTAGEFVFASRRRSGSISVSAVDHHSRAATRM